MCIAIMSKEGVTIPKEHLEQSFRINDDGAGFMYAENDTLHVKKGFMDFNSFYEAYKPHEDKPIAVHFRITTHGDTDEANTHPFQVGNNLAFIHNGIINAVDRPDKTKSDTYWFNQKILVPVYKRDSRFIFKEHFKELVREYIGWSKLVFLNNKGHHTIINEDKGVWDEGVWYSNSSYKPRQVKQDNHPRQRISPVVEKKEPAVFALGSRVRVAYTHNTALNGEGVINYFTGGQMVGVTMDGQDSPRLIHISFLFPVTTPIAFKEGDWVVKKDDPERIGEVKGIAGTGVILWWLGPNGMFTGPNYVVNADKLDYWWDTTKEAH